MKTNEMFSSPFSEDHFISGLPSWLEPAEDHTFSSPFNEDHFISLLGHKPWHTDSIQRNPCQNRADADQLA